MTALIVIAAALVAFIYLAMWIYRHVIRPNFPRINPLAYFLGWVIVVCLFFNSPAGRHSLDSYLCSSAESLLDSALVENNYRDLSMPCDAYFESCFPEGGTPRADISRLCNKS
jgi:hypothetical protein